jgi:hypothetical protein
MNRHNTPLYFLLIELPISHMNRINTTTMSSDCGPRAKCEQVIFEAIAKACETIVTARCNAPSSCNQGSRFHLHVPELPSVRAVLQLSRRALHVPLRLDVYTCVKNGKKDLLERWCFEYSAATTTTHATHETNLQDPIAQLRHVCKRIVLWLRLLCCWTRLLPSQRLKGSDKLGFSLYVATDSDAKDLQLQGFVTQLQPSSVLTPYGELSWKVAYATRVDQYLSRPVSAAIPIKWRLPEERHVALQSAPEYDWQMMEARQPIQQAGTFDPSSRKMHEQQPPHQQCRSYNVAQQHQMEHPLQRRHTYMEPAETDVQEKLPERERNMSALSLAMMMSEQDGEKRRAALHQMPLHLLEQQQQQQSSSSSNNNPAEYGYAYNNHISWKQIHPSINNATTGQSDSTRFLGSGGAEQSGFVSGTPPTCAAFVTGLSPSPFSHLLPPRAPAATPPFAPRPLSFAQDVPALSLLTSTPSTKPAPPSLDLLGSSPFQQRQQQQQHGMLSSLLLLDSTATTTTGTAIHSGDLRRSLWTSSFPTHPQRPLSAEEDYGYDDMPFAVFDTTTMDASSFAQHSNNRLSFMSGTTNAAVNSLADQLAEFKLFGASLTVGGGGGSSDHSGSASAPITSR